MLITWKFRPSVGALTRSWTYFYHNVLFYWKTLNKWPNPTSVGVGPVRSMSDSILRMLHNVALRPGLTPAEHAREMGLTRAAVHQLLSKIKTRYGLRIRGLFDYPSIGMVVIGGWAQSRLKTPLSKFERWLRANPYVYRIFSSAFTSHGDHRVYFERLFLLHQDVLPPSLTTEDLLVCCDDIARFIEQLHRFEKRPYHLTIHYDVLQSETMHLNLAKFDGHSWDIEQGFRLEAMLEAVRRYGSVLPDPSVTDRQIVSFNRLNTADLTVLSCLEHNYFSTYRDVLNLFRRLGLSPPPDRTIRRRLRTFRLHYVHPYIQIENIGLTKRFIVTLHTEDGSDSPSKILKAQSSVFPQCRVVTGSRMLVLDLKFPVTVTLPQFSFAISTLVPQGEQICVFDVDTVNIEKELAQVLQYIIRTRPKIS